jgi:hypothetical protein
LLHPPGLRRLQSVAFRLAWEWFGCKLGAAQEEVAQLPSATRTWFDHFALSPSAVPFDSNKDEIWLHLSLLESRRDAIAVVRRRLFPGRLPAAVDSVYVPDVAMNWRRRIRKQFRWIYYAGSRFGHHAMALPRVAASGLQWWWRSTTK